EECTTHFERWLYLLRHLSELEDTPEHFNEGIFAKLFGEAEIARFDKKQLMAYDESLKYYRDLKNSVDTAWGEGHEEGEKIGIEKGEKIGIEKGEKIGIEKGEKIGIEKGARERALATAQAMKSDGVPLETIAKYTGLTANEIEDL
ncbi:MAG: hypothetical protein EOL87_19215, partial [Spartobacteria bacterium]|nr:hypothetical protein [Spartobacteria bacterium]